MAGTGMEMMLRALGLNPDEMKKSLGGIGNLVQSIDARLGRLEQNQRAIMAHLGVTDDGQRTESDRSAVDDSRRANG